ncbi:MAG TPA: DUF5985 family protein [Usitatibacter sp.]|nr:DUF5985 family protein [Usitatibacter sp.]
MDELLIGGIVTASFVAGLFFLRFWRASGDRFFLLFALSFWIEGANRFLLAHYVGPNEDAPFYYLVRLLAYGLIIAAIVMKNRSSR